MAGAVVSMVTAHDVDDLELAQALSEAALPLGDDEGALDRMTADPALLDNIPAYPNREANPRRIATDGTMMAAPYSLAWFHTSDTPDAVQRYYERVIADAGVLWTSQKHGANLRSVGWMPRYLGDTALDGGPVALPMYLVGITTQTGKTLVLMSKTYPEQMLQGADGLPEGVVLPPRASPPQVVTVTAESGGAPRQTISAQVEEASLTEVDAFYRRHLERGGWKSDASQSTPERKVLSAQRQDARWSVVLRQEKSAVQVLMTYERSGP